MALQCLHIFEHYEAFLFVVTTNVTNTTNTGSVCCFQTFNLCNLGAVLPESGVPQSDILMSLVVS